MANLSVNLAAYLDGVSRRRWQYGTLDCCTFMADWLMACGCADPMRGRRGTYATYREYRTAIRSEGGLVRSCARRFAAIGLQEVDTARPGDVALVLAPSQIGRRVVMVATGGICVSPDMRVIVATDVSLVGAKLDTIKVWSIRG